MISDGKKVRDEGRTHSVPECGIDSISRGLSFQKEDEDPQPWFPPD